MLYYLFKYILIYTIKVILFTVSANIRVYDQGIVPLERDSVAIQLYVDIKNQCKDKHCKVFIVGDKCCLVHKGREDCIFNVIGGDMGSIEPNQKRRIILVYPTIYQHDKNGFCNVILQYKCGKKRNRRYFTKINFNTHIYNKRKKRINNKTLKSYRGMRIQYCKFQDENPFEECTPVNCEWKYDGHKSYFDKRLKECTDVPTCVGDDIDSLPSVVYVPKINKCKAYIEPVTFQDVYAIKNGLGVEKVNFEKEIKVKQKIVMNNLTISQNLQLLKDLLYGKFQVSGIDECDYRKTALTAIKSIIEYVVIVTAMILSFLCCLNACVSTCKRLSRIDINNYWFRLKSKFGEKVSEDSVNEEIRDNLLRDVIIRDIPLDLRHKNLDICDRIGREIRRKKRYRSTDLGSQFSLKQLATSDSS